METGWYLVIGLAAVMIGAEILVRGASGLARSVGISPLVIGLTVVAYGTSCPEFGVSIAAGLAGLDHAALGNVVGSNIVNILLVLGITAVLTPLSASRQMCLFDVPVMIGASILLLVLGWDGVVSVWDGLILLACLVVYTLVALWRGRGRQEPPAESLPANDGAAPSKRIWDDWRFRVGLVIVGLILLVLGSRWMVDSAVDLARRIGVSDLVIGLTVLAVGTSLAELAVSAVAAVRKQADMSLGNVVGSNIVNICGVLGLAAVVSPSGIAVPPEALRLDIPLMIAVAVAALPVVMTDGMVSRREGAVLVGYYAIYTAYLLMNGAQSPWLTVFRTALFIAIIVTGLALVGASFRQLIAPRRDKA
ncbi:MAG: calcium/sodium antiporter [Thermodesulfobacteriota bacterium]